MSVTSIKAALYRVDFCLNIPIVALAVFNRNFIWKEEVLRSAVNYAAESIFLLQVN